MNALLVLGALMQAPVQDGPPAAAEPIARPDFEAELGGARRFRFDEFTAPVPRKVLTLIDTSASGRLRAWSFVQVGDERKTQLVQLINLVDEAHRHDLLGLGPSDRLIAALFVHPMGYLQASDVTIDSLDSGPFRTRERISWKLRSPAQLVGFATYAGARACDITKHPDEEGIRLVLDADQRQALRWFLYEHAHGVAARLAEREAELAKVDLDAPVFERDDSRLFEEGTLPGGTPQKVLSQSVSSDTGPTELILESRADKDHVLVAILARGMHISCPHDADAAGAVASGVQLVYRSGGAERALSSSGAECGGAIDRIAWSVEPRELLALSASPVLYLRNPATGRTVPVVLDRTDREAVRWFVHFQVDGGAELERAWWKDGGQRAIEEMRAYPPRLDGEGHADSDGWWGGRYKVDDENAGARRHEVGMLVRRGVRSASDPQVEYIVELRYVENERGAHSLSLALWVSTRHRWDAAAVDFVAPLRGGQTLRLPGEFMDKWPGLRLDPRDLLRLSEVVEFEVRFGDESERFRLDPAAAQAMRWFVYRHVPGGRRLAFEHWTEAHWQRAVETTPR